MARLDDLHTRCRRARPLLGTLVDIEARGPDAHHAVACAFDAIAEVHRLMNRHDPASDIGRLNAAPEGSAVPVHPRTATVLHAATHLCSDSDGAFDCTRHADWPGQMRWEISGNVVRKLGPGQFDLGGIAKGFAVDCAIEAARAHRVGHVLVNAGGDIRHFGNAPMTMHLRDPQAPATVAIHYDLFNEALASSSAAGLAATPDGPSRIVGALRDLPRRAGASVIAPTCMLADAFTKIVLISGNPGHPLLARYGARTVLYRDGFPEGVTTPE